MAKEPYFPFYYRDFLVSTGEMSDALVGKYIRYLIHQWEKGSIPSDPTMIQTIRFDQDLWATLESKFPLCDDGRRRNPRLEEIRLERDQYIAKRSAAGKVGAEARWDGKRNANANAIKHGKQHGKTIASTSISTPSSSTLPSPKEKKKEPEQFYITLSQGFLEFQRQMFPKESAWKNFDKCVSVGAKNLELFNTQNDWSDSEIESLLDWIPHDGFWSRQIRTLGGIRNRKDGEAMKFENAKASMLGGHEETLEEQMKRLRSAP